MRKRIKLNRICSSEDYKHSMITHKEILQENHDNNTAYLNMVISTPVKNHKRKAFVKWGEKLLEIPTDIAKNMSSDINIIWK